MTKISTGKIKLIAVIASLAALAVVLSPIFSILQIPGTNAIQGDGFPADASFIPDDTVVEEISQKDLEACSPLSADIDEILGVTNDTVDVRTVASDTLHAEFCSRPVLIDEILTMDNHALSLVAYACDASAGMIGTAAIQDSLTEYSAIYCESANQFIIDETNTFLASIEEFRTSMDEEEEAGIDSGFFNEETRATLVKVEQSLEECIAQVHESQYYPAAKSFDNASKMFLGIFTEEEPIDEGNE